MYFILTVQMYIKKPKLAIFLGRNFLVTGCISWFFVPFCEKLCIFAPMEDKDFEILWLQNRERLLAEDAEWQAMKESYKVHGVTDVLFYAIPIIVGIMCLDYLPIANELLRWVVCAGIIIVVMAICMLMRTAGKGVKSASDIEKRVKEEYRKASSNSPREVKVRGEK